jgi:hypothetical protein
MNAQFWRLRGRGLVLAVGLVVAGAAAAALRRPGGQADSDRAVEHVPAARLPRLPELADATFEVADAGLILEFDATPDRLALLDAVNARVLVLRRTAAGWEPHVSFGRSGDGPGELRHPHGVAFAAQGIVVADQARLHFFTAGGQYVRSLKPRSTCALLRPGVAAGATGLFLHGTCMRRNAETELVTAVLYWSTDGTEFVELASDVRSTRDGRFGSFLGAKSAFREGTDYHLFGAGSANCIHVVRDEPPRPRVERLCDLSAGRYRAPPPRSLEQRLARERARRPAHRHLLRWPDELPVYVEAMAAGEHTVLMRPFSADSVVFELTGSRRELLVARYNGLVSCRRYACLWTDYTTDGVRLTLLRLQRLAEAVALHGSDR